MKILKNKQGTEEWLEDRKGKLTASNAQAIGNNGKGLETYIYNLLAEKYSSNVEYYTNEDIERGNELEDMARKLYELKTGKKIEEVGFCEQDEFVGCSPDGLIGDDGGIEIKCMNDKNHFHLVATNKIDTKYLWQIQMNLMITGRKWWDFIGFNPNFKKDLVIIRIEPDLKKHEKLKLGIEKGKKLIKELTKKYELS